MGDLQGRVALVTGCAQGIGFAIAHALADRGAAVACVDIDGPGASDVAAAIGAKGGRARSYELDVADGDAIRRALEETFAEWGRLDMLCNNAYASEPEILAGDRDVVSTPIAVWDRVMAVNVRAPMLACQHAIPLMLEGEAGGSILNVSSTSAFLGDVVFVAYSSSKAALQALTRAVATSHGRAGIRCNALATGLVVTADAQRNLDGPMFEIYRRHRLLDAVGTPDEVAKLATYLLSDDSAYVTGQTFVVDGGALAHQPWNVDAPLLHPELFPEVQA